MLKKNKNIFNFVFYIWSSNFIHYKFKSKSMLSQNLYTLIYINFSFLKNLNFFKIKILSNKLQKVTNNINLNLLI